MKVFERSIRKILNEFSDKEITFEDAVRKACLAFEKEVDDPSGESLEERRQAFKDRLRPFADKYSVDVLEKFFTYWTGLKTPKSRQMNFEKMKTFNMSMRLSTWVENQRKFATDNAKQRREARLNYGRK